MKMGMCMWLSGLPTQCPGEVRSLDTPLTAICATRSTQVLFMFSSDTCNRNTRYCYIDNQISNPIYQLLLLYIIFQWAKLQKILYSFLKLVMEPNHKLCNLNCHFSNKLKSSTLFSEVLPQREHTILKMFLR